MQALSGSGAQTAAHGVQGAVPDSDGSLSEAGSNWKGEQTEAIPVFGDTTSPLQSRPNITSLTNTTTNTVNTVSAAVSQPYTLNVQQSPLMFANAVTANPVTQTGQVQNMGMSANSTVGSSQNMRKYTVTYKGRSYVFKVQNDHAWIDSTRGNESAL